MNSVIKVMLITYTSVSTRSKLLIKIIICVIMTMKILIIRITLVTKDMDEIKNSYSCGII